MRALVKVNLTLHVGALRADGYHPVSSICLFPDIGDTVELGGRASDFSLLVEGPEASAIKALAPADNLILKAARLLAASVQIAPRRLRLVKRVPSAAGIAGGTADAAAALVLLNAEARRPLAPSALIALSRRFGADGPVCTAARLEGGGAWLAEGDGDRVSAMRGPAPLHIVLVNPRVPVPTQKVFAAFDAAASTGDLAQPSGDLRVASGLVAVGKAGRNDLRAAALTVLPTIAVLEAEMSASPGCRFARMSGSGGTVFGLFASRSAAERAALRFAAQGHWAESGVLRR